MKPATSTRRNAVTSIFGERGVSMGTSKKLVHALVNVSRTRLAIVAALRAVIDFFEQIVVLSDKDVLRVECDGFFVRLARVFEAPFVLVSNPQVVPGSGVSGIRFRRLLPAVHGFFPESVLRDLDAEVHLRLRARSCVGEHRLGSHTQQGSESGGSSKKQSSHFHGCSVHYSHPLQAPQAVSSPVTHGCLLSVRAMGVP